MGKKDSITVLSLPGKKWWVRQTHLVVVRAVGGFLHGRVFLFLSDLHADHGVHVEPHQLPGLDDGDADLRRGIRGAFPHQMLLLDSHFGFEAFSSQCWQFWGFLGKARELRGGESRRPRASLILQPQSMEHGFASHKIINSGGFGEERLGW